MDVATGDHINELPPKPNANENKPATVVSVVITTGNNLRLAAKNMLCSRLMPFLRLLLAVDISTIAVFTAMPASATIPYIVNRLNGLFETNKPSTTPTKASGTETKIISG